MEGVGTPELLLPDGASPHTFQLKPSTLKQLKEADLIIWVGPSLEMFMIKPLKQSRAATQLITLQDIPGLTLYPMRDSREWQHDHDHHDHEGHDHQHGGIDPHIWLSTHNTEEIIAYITHTLVKMDPPHATQYLTNAKKLTLQIAQLRENLSALLASVQTQPFLVYHDGYQYFEKEFHLNAVGTMILNPHLPLSANGLHSIQQLIQKHDIKCVFRETEFNQATIQNSLSQFPVRVAELDPLGVHFPAGPDNYVQTLSQLAQTLKACLRAE